MAKYEATSPITLTAGFTMASGLRGLLCKIGATGRTALPAQQEDNAPIIGVFAQDSCTTGEPVTVNQLMGKMTMVADAAITVGHIVYPSVRNDAAAIGKITGKATLAAGEFGIGVALEAATAHDDYIQVLASPMGLGV